MRRVLFLCFVCMVSSGCRTLLTGRVAPLSDDYIKPVIAVSSFDNKSSFSGQWNLGTGMADLLISELVASRNFEVVERRHLKKVIGELERQHGQHFRKEGKAAAGRLKNARYLIRGEITDFSQVGGGGLVIAFRKFLFGGRGYRARVAMTLTVIDIQTGSIVDSVQCEGDALAREGYVRGRYKDVRFGGDMFFKTPLGVSTSEAMRKGIKGIIRTVPKTEWQPMIAEVVDSKQIIINGGSERKIRKGQRFYIRGESRAITDPATGDVIKVLPGPVVAAVVVIDAGEKVSYAQTVKTDTKKLKRGMVLKPMPKQK